MANQTKSLDNVSRREFAAIAAKTFLGVGMFSAIGSQAFGVDDEKSDKPTLASGTAKNCIYLYMNGGMTPWIRSTQNRVPRLKVR